MPPAKNEVEELKKKGYTRFKPTRRLTKKTQRDLKPITSFTFNDSVISYKIVLLQKEQGLNAEEDNRL